MTGQKKRIAVVTVPFFRSAIHINLAENTLTSILACNTVHELDLIAIINGAKESERDQLRKIFNYVEDNDRNCLARAWNKGITLGLERGADFVLVINLDMIFHSAYIDNLVAYAIRRPEGVLWSGHPWQEVSTLESATLEGESEFFPHYNAFLVNDRLFNLVGKFDEQFEPAYLEDMDMAYRLKLAGLYNGSTHSARFYHINRGTILGAQLDNDMEFLNRMTEHLDEVHRRYTVKWGGLPMHETFTVPYGA